MLKPKRCKGRQLRDIPAAFRRLCVETPENGQVLTMGGPAAFRRLCVETFVQLFALAVLLPSRL